MKFLKTTLIAFSLLLLNSINAQQQISLTEENWILPEGASFETLENKKTLFLPKGRAFVKNLNFKTGVIEVDVYAKEKRSFAGITFRRQHNTMEEVYMRLHKSNQADAVQYTPIFNNESNWQLYREHQAKVKFKTSGWNTLKIEVKETSVTAYVNNVKVLDVTKLKTDNIDGNIGLWALFGSRFSNFRVTPNLKENSATAENNSVSTEEGIITKWDITKAFSYNKNTNVTSEVFKNYAYTTVSTEASGLLPFSKFIKKTSSGNFEQNSENYVVAKTEINSESSTSKAFSFDYSDKIIVFLNGEIVFKGNNAFRQKGVQFMGHLNVSTNTLLLPLKKGLNTIHCVIIEKANGWGLIGKIK